MLGSWEKNIAFSFLPTKTRPKSNVGWGLNFKKQQKTRVEMGKRNFQFIIHNEFYVSLRTERNEDHNLVISSEFVSCLYFSRGPASEGWLCERDLRRIDNCNQHTNEKRSFSAALDLIERKFSFLLFFIHS